MKKLFAFVVAVGIVVILGACSKQSEVSEEAFDILVSCSQKMGELESLHFSVGMDMMEQNSKMELNGSFISEGPQMSMVMALEAQGNSMNDFMELYLKDNMVYLSALGTKMAQPIEANIPMGSKGMEFDREELKKNLEEATVDGDTLHMVLKKEWLEMGNAQLKQMATASDAKINNIFWDIELEDDYMTKMALTLTGTDEKGKAFEFVINVVLDQFNSVEEIDFPQDLDEWPSAQEADGVLSGLLE